MTIRARLTAWYAGIMFISLLTMGLLMYREFAPEPHPQNSAAEQSSEGDEADLREVLRILFWCGVPPALIAVAGGWWLMRRALTPIAQLTVAAGKIHDRNLRDQLPRTGNGDELDRLTEVFNAMTARLDDSFTRIREFTLHASHELKTPLTILHGEMETALRDGALAPAQREIVLSQLDEVQRLAKIVDGLTLLTKADAGQVALNFEPLVLGDIVRDVFPDAQILAKPANISVTLAACEVCAVRGDRHRLRQLLLNLADNAVKYCDAGGAVRMELRVENSVANLSIANTGPGIPPEQLSRVFEPFFRGDASHQRTVDGCGLGLSIAQWIVAAHGGNIAVTSESGKQTVVTVELPLDKAGGKFA